MKRKFLLNIILLLFTMIGEINAQTITEAEKQQIIEKIKIVDEAAFYHIINEQAVFKVINYKIVEAESALIETLWKIKDPFIREEYLMALLAINSPRTHELTLANLDTLNNDPNSSVRDKASLNRILFRYRDFSKRDLVYQQIQSVNYCDRVMLFLLLDILEYYSPNELTAKNEVIKVVRSTKNTVIERTFAYEYLYKIYGAEQLPLAFEMAENDPDGLNRKQYISDFIALNKNKNTYEFLMRRLPIENDPGAKYVIGEILLQDYPNPKCYTEVKKVAYAESDSIYSDISRGTIDYFRFDLDQISKDAVCTNIDTLISYHPQCIANNWIGDQTFASQIKTYLTEAKTKLASGDSLGAALKIKIYQNQIVEQYKDTVKTDGKFVTEDGYKFLYYYPKYILERLPKLPAVKLNNSQGSLLEGGTLQYYEGSWKDAVNNNDGTFTVPTTLKTLSLKMNYAYGSQQKNNVTVGADTIVFQTKNVQVKLLDSSGAILDTGKVQYYSGAWRDFGLTTNGVAVKELLPATTTFRAVLGSKQLDKTQNTATNNNVEIKLP